MAFVSHKEARADLDSAGSEHECRRRSASVEDPSRGHYRNIEGVRYLWHERHCMVVAYVSAGLRPFGDHRVGSALLHLDRVCDRCDYGDDLDSCRLPRGHECRRRACSRRQYLHSFLYYHGCDFRGVGRLEHYVDSERLVCQFAAFAYLFPDGLRAEVYGRDESQSSCLRYGRGETRVGYPRHSSLEQGIAYAEHFTNLTLDHLRFLFSAQNYLIN